MTTKESSSWAVGWTVFAAIMMIMMGGWWVVALPMDIAPDGMGWVSAAYVTTANIEGVPVIPTPPLE